MVIHALWGERLLRWLSLQFSTLGRIHILYEELLELFILPLPFLRRLYKMQDSATSNSSIIVLPTFFLRTLGAIVSEWWLASRMWPSSLCFLALLAPLVLGTFDIPLLTQDRASLRVLIILDNMNDRDYHTSFPQRIECLIMKAIPKQADFYESKVFLLITFSSIHV